MRQSDITTSAFAAVLYQARSREDGHEVEDWLKAQAEVTAARS